MGMGWWQFLLAIGGGTTLLWLALVGALWLTQRNNRDPASLRDVLRLLPDVIRLLRRLAADPDLPRSDDADPMGAGPAGRPCAWA